MMMLVALHKKLNFFQKFLTKKIRGEVFVSPARCRGAPAVGAGHEWQSYQFMELSYYQIVEMKQLFPSTLYVAVFV